MVKFCYLLDEIWNYLPSMLASFWLVSWISLNTILISSCFVKGSLELIKFWLIKAYNKYNLFESLFSDSLKVGYPNILMIFVMFAYTVSGTKNFSAKNVSFRVCLLYFYLNIFFFILKQ